MLHDHEHFFACTPNQPKLEKTLLSDPAPPLPEGVTPVRGTACWRIKEVVHALPAGLWDSEVVSSYEFTDIEDGLFVCIRSPLNVVLETFWRVREAPQVQADEGEEGAVAPASGLEVVEEVTVKCSRLLVGTVKGACDGNWETIHHNMIAGIKA